MVFDFDPNDHRCRYLRINGARCRQPALDGETLCFEHKLRKLRTRPGRKPVCLPSSTFNEIPLVSFCWIEDHASILSNLNHVIEAFAHGAIDHRQAVAYGCLLRTAIKTLKQMHDLEDLAVKEKEKPAQRFELDECELPLAIDEPRPPATDQSSSVTATSPSSAGGPHVCPVLADMGSEQSPSAAEPTPVQPSTLSSDPQPPASEPQPATCNLEPATCSLNAVRCTPPSSNPSPFLDLDCENSPWLSGKRIRERWEESVRDYYKNDPTMLATLNIKPRPEPATNGNPQPETCNLELTAPTDPCNPQPETCNLEHPAPNPCNLQPETCNLSSLEPETCTLELTAAAESLPAPSSQLPAFLSPNPYSLTPFPRHTYTLRAKKLSVRR